MSRVVKSSIDTVATDVAIDGADITDATILPANYNIVISGTTGMGCKLDVNTPIGGHQLIVLLISEKNVNVYPPDTSSNCVFDGTVLSAGAPILLGTTSGQAKAVRCERTSALTWYCHNMGPPV